MSKPRVLIVGAGALGLTCAYHLQLAGAEIAFLVRPHRLQALSRPQRLFSYSDHDVKTLEGYAVHTAAQELRGQRFDFILLTLDGATCRSEQGTATLRALGDALADSGAVMVINGVGIGLYEHVLEHSGFPAPRLLEGTMKSFAYQVGAAGTPQPAPGDFALHDSADIAYYNFPDGVGFVLASRPKAAARAFAALYDNCPVVRCQKIPAAVYRISPNSFFAFTVASELNGWRGTEALIADTELWHLCCVAQREIVGLKGHGLVGKLMAFAMSDARMAKTMRGMEEAARPIGFTAFNRFHHGGKVLAQNVQVLENCVAAGAAAGQELAATKTLLERWHSLHPGP